MKNIVVLGAGFAGLEAARTLSKRKQALCGYRIILIDKKTTSDFLPILPDVVSGRIDPQNARAVIRASLNSQYVEFINDEAVSVDLKSKYIYLSKGTNLSYDYLILAVGSETNFFNRPDFVNVVYRIDEVVDAVKLKDKLKSLQSKTILVIGGGYTGVEVSTAVARLFKQMNLPAGDIYIVDVAKDILGPLPEWMKNYVRANFVKQKINILTGVSLESYDGKKAILSDGREFSDAVVIWAPGVKAPALVANLGLKSDRQSRLLTDKFLSVAPGVYAAGDCAAFAYKDKILRMAVQFSIFQARVAAMNVCREISGRNKLEYKPVDLGYVVPMANKTACGEILGIRVKGFVAWLMHWFMCIYRSQDSKARFGILKDLICGGGKNR